ncbi:MAG TPA: NADH-quinone oxidoreductase subunit D [Candidatus Eisenbacteria bacterium]|nr:NADH-quinone oxidoreductase subunit D [Candidatus Eisenbacteria bacterium]
MGKPVDPNLKPTETRSMLLNIGPQHPAMHGIVRMITELDGETVLGVDIEIGYLHRAFEKMCEQGPYNNAIPYTDRLNYVSPLINNIGYCLAVERLFGLDTTDRCKYIRVVMSEISRITDHLTCIGASAMELGAFTVFLYMIKARELLYELIESVTGARLTISYARIGGLKADLPEGFAPKALAAIKETRSILKEIEALLDKNRIFVDRLRDTGVTTKEHAVAYGVTGPFLRSTGVDYDVRKAQPYLVYDRLDFDVPVGEHGDNLDRYYVRMEEMQQSMRIVEQALAAMPAGPVMVDMQGREIPAAAMVDEAKMGRTLGFKQADVVADPTLDGTTRSFHETVYAKDKRVALPAKEDTYGNIEGLMNHFKLVMYGHGLRPPKGESYFAVEGANGELGFYVVSDGTDRPYRVRVRPPCFPIMAALPQILTGEMVADIIPTFGSVNMIGGELDH